MRSEHPCAIAKPIKALVRASLPASPHRRCTRSGPARTAYCTLHTAHCTLVRPMQRPQLNGLASAPLMVLPPLMALPPLLHTAYHAYYSMAIHQQSDICKRLLQCIQLALPLHTTALHTPALHTPAPLLALRATTDASRWPRHPAQLFCCQRAALMSCYGRRHWTLHPAYHLFRLLHNDVHSTLDLPLRRDRR